MSTDPGSDPPDADPVRSVLDDDDLETILEHYDDPAHPEALVVDDIRGFLDDLQAVLSDNWEGILEDVEAGDLEVVSDTGPAVVFVDPGRRRWNGLLDAVGVDEVAGTVLRVAHYYAGKRLADRPFDGVDPIVVAKPSDAEAGQWFLAATIAQLRNEGLSFEEAWAYYGLELRDGDPTTYAERFGYADSIDAADATERGRELLDR